MLISIAAISDNFGIGYKNGIPWKVPEDFKFFKETTMGAPVVMGRLTRESIGRDLPKRENIILSRNGDVTIEDIVERGKKEDIFIIGGAHIYRAFIPFTDVFLLTHIPGKYEVDTFYPRDELLKELNAGNFVGSKVHFGSGTLNISRFERGEVS